MRLLLEPRFLPLTLSAGLALACLFASLISPAWQFFFACGFVAFAMLSALGVHDITQTRHAVLRNYPISAHLRFMLESVRPEMRQYFFEGEKDGAPFPATSGRSSINARKKSSTSDPSARCSTSIRNNTNGCTTRLRQPSLWLWQICGCRSAPIQQAS